SLMKNEEFSAIKIPAWIVLAEDDQQVLHSETLDSITAGIRGVAVNSVPDVGHYASLAPCILRGKFFIRSLCKESLYVSRAELHNSIRLRAAVFPLHSYDRFHFAVGDFCPPDGNARKTFYQITYQKQTCSC